MTEITGRHVLVALILFFGVVIVTNIIFVKLAVTSFPGEEVEKSYYQGLSYNETLADRHRQASMGWRLNLVAQPKAGSVAFMTIRLVDKDGKAVGDAVVRGEIVRPTTDRGRTPFKFEALTDGTYRARLTDLERGAWNLSVIARPTTDDPPALSATTRIDVQ